MIEKIKKYIMESFEELKRVKWLNKKETFDLTLEVLFFSLIFILIYGLFDSIFVRIIFSLK